MIDHVTKYSWDDYKDQNHQIDTHYQGNEIYLSITKKFIIHTDTPAYKHTQWHWAVAQNGMHTHTPPQWYKTPTNTYTCEHTWTHAYDELLGTCVGTVVRGTHNLHYLWAKQATRDLGIQNGFQRIEIGQSTELTPLVNQGKFWTGETKMTRQST